MVKYQDKRVFDWANSHAARHMLMRFDGIAYAVFPVPASNDNFVLIGNKNYE